MVTDNLEKVVASKLPLHSKLQDLRTIDFQIDEVYTGEELFQAFQSDILLPSAILIRQGVLNGFISRVKEVNLYEFWN
jgi:hypothetical protein